MNLEKLAIIAGPGADPQAAATELRRRHQTVDAADADVIVALGGDGIMLKTLHETMNRRVPIYGMNFGSVGFLMNNYSPEGLLERIETAEVAELNPLRMLAVREGGDEVEALAVNEVSLLRETGQTAKIRITIDGKVRMEELMCDGVLVATPAGSTAYNFSVHGPILPIDADILALTPISAFRPRRWRGALLPHDARVRFDVLESDKRPVSAVADNKEVRKVSRVDVEEDRSIALLLLFDHGHHLAERIRREQFLG